MPSAAFCVGLWRPSAAMGGTRAAKNATRAAEKAKPGAPADNKTTRSPRIAVGFHKLRFAVDPDKIASAKKALRAAFAENADWEPEAWKNRAEVVLQPFREGIQWGGASSDSRARDAMLVWQLRRGSRRQAVAQVQRTLCQRRWFPPGLRLCRWRQRGTKMDEAETRRPTAPAALAHKRRPMAPMNPMAPMDPFLAA